MGSNKVLRVALGGDAATEYRTNLSQLAERVRGSTGLFFTKLPREQVSQLRWACMVWLVQACEGAREPLSGHPLPACRGSRRVERAVLLLPHPALLLPGQTAGLPLHPTRQHCVF